MNLPEEMSLPEKVFELLGVKPLEPFRLRDCLYRITRNFDLEAMLMEGEKSRVYTIGDILSGRVKIRKSPRYTESDLYLAKGYLANGFPYVARDENKTIHVFMNKPRKFISVWMWAKCDNSYFRLPVESFESVSWDDPEPLSLQSVIDEMEGMKCSK